MLGAVVLLPLLLFVHFGIWYAHHRSEAPLLDEQPRRQIALPAAQPLPTMPDRAEAAVVHDVAAAPAAPMRNTARTVRIKERVEQPSAAALGRCGNQNFFMRAICVNNTCAQPAYRSLPQCSRVIAQRRIDEQRHNAPLLD